MSTTGDHSESSTPTDLDISGSSIRSNLDIPETSTRLGSDIRTNSDIPERSIHTNLDIPESLDRPISDILGCSTLTSLGIPRSSTCTNIDIPESSTRANLDIPGSSTRTSLDPAKDYDPIISESILLPDRFQGVNLSNYILPPTKGIHIRSGDQDVASPGKNLQISFPNVSAGKERKDKGPCENPVKFIEPCSTKTPEMQPKENLTGGPSILNLRKWLEGDPSEVKARRMDLFRQVLALVDHAHDQGIGLLDLRPSSFIFKENGRVDYMGHILHCEMLAAGRDGTDNKFSAQNILSYYASFEKLSEGRIESRSGEIDVKDGEELEKEWYGFPRGLRSVDLLKFNVYCLGLMLFEFLSNFESIEARNATMAEVNRRMLRQHYVNKFPVEAGFCFWLMQPEPSSRPSTREILQSEYLNRIDSNLNNEEKVEYNNFPTPNIDTEEECDLLLYFLHTLLEQKQNQALELAQHIKMLESDIDVISRALASALTRSDPDVSITGTSVVQDKLLSNIDDLETAYFSMRAHSQLQADPTHHLRSDTDVLRERDSWPGNQAQASGPPTEEFQIVSFFEGICRFARYSRLEVCGRLNHQDIMNSYDAMNGLCLDRDEEYVAMAGVSMKIKIFDVGPLLDEDEVDFHYPMLEMANPHSFSGICWNSYIRNYLVSSDYDGAVKIWDVSTGQEFARLKEHRTKARSVDISRINPNKFASGGDDGSVRLWTMNQKSSVGVIWNETSVSCVQYSPYSSHMLAYGAADHNIYLYDLRHTKIPWTKMAGHRNAVSHVRFVDQETVVSSSTDSTLKLWDLKKTTLQGLSTDACGLTFSGHTNERRYVGLATFDGYIACGSETNEVYMYYRSLPMPITSYKFESMDPATEEDVANNGVAHMVSSVCWRRKTSMLFAANSSGSMRIFRMA